MTDTINLSSFDPRLVERWAHAANPFSIEAVPTRSASKKNGKSRTVPISLNCPNGHGYQREIGVPLPREPRLGCPECEGSKVCQGINDLESQRPDLVEIWDFEKNVKLPSEISIHTNERVFWHNKACGHKYDTKLGNQTDKQIIPVSCPICTFRILQSGVNDLKTLRPDLMKLWSPSNTLDPARVFPETQKRALWQCPKGKDHTTSVNIDYMVRTNGTSCRVCDGKELCVGFNDAASRLLHCLDEWDLEANGGVTLYDFQMTGKQAKNYWHWRCRDDDSHTWQAMPIQRISGYGKCPHCYRSRSSLEVEVFEWVRSVWPEAQRNNRSTLGGRLELDIWLPSLRTGIEVNGEFWHSEVRDPTVKESHDLKESLAKSKGVLLIVLWEKLWVEDSKRAKTDILDIISSRTLKEKYTYTWRRMNPS